MKDIFLETSSSPMVKSISSSKTNRNTSDYISVEQVTSPSSKKELQPNQKLMKKRTDASFLVQQNNKQKSKDSQLSRPTTSSPAIKKYVRRPNTASPSFQRHRIKIRSPHSDGKSRSKENWIPEEIRQKMLKRDLAVAMVNFEEKETCNTSMKHVTQRNKDSLERSLCKEKFGIEQRKTCGLCCRKFLPVNLVLAVPLKAVLDIRDSWGDKFDPEGSKRIRVNPNLRKAPACYNSIRVCAFCAQLFDQQQETYRPSWEAKEAEKERLRSVEEAARRKVKNDPLSQIDKERDAEVYELTKSLQHQELIKVTTGKWCSRRTSVESSHHI